MKVSKSSLDVLEQLQREAAMLITAKYEEEDIEDLGRVYRVGRWVRSEPHTGHTCYVRTDGVIVALDGAAELDPLIRHISTQADEVNKELTHSLLEILNYADPYEVGPDPDHDGRCYVGVRILGCMIDDGSIVDIIEQWFGVVSVDTRLLKIHLKDGGYIGWWLEHSPSTKTPNI